MFNFFAKEKGLDPADPARTKGTAGVTLIEVMLVLAIGGLLLVLGFRQYQQYRFDANIQQLKFNVDVIFKAAADYYQANCRDMRDMSGNVVHAGALDPANITTNFLSVPLSTLRSEGFLTQQFPYSPILSQQKSADDGYYVQFNRVIPSTDRTICLTSACITPTSVGTIVLWKIQISLLLANPTLTPQYKALLQADCFTFMVGGNILIPCSNNVSGGSYIGWERLPSVGIFLGGQSQYWMSDPTLKQFNQMYTTYPILYLTTQYQTANQNYLCGG